MVRRGAGASGVVGGPAKTVAGSTAPPSGPSTDCGPSFRGSGLATNILKGGAAGKVVGKLLRDGLIEEVSAAASLQRGAVTMTRGRGRCALANGLAGGQARIGDAARVMSELCSLILCALVRLFRSSTCRTSPSARRRRSPMRRTAPTRHRRHAQRDRRAPCRHHTRKEHSGELSRPLW